MIEYRNHRIKIADLFLESGKNLETGSLWILDPQKITYKLGESLDSLKIPFHLGAEDEEVIDSALISLLNIFNARFGTQKEPGSKTSDFNPSVGGISNQAQYNLKEKHYKTDTFTKGTPEHKAAKLILRSTPYVDGEMVALWLGSGGAGKDLMAWTNKIFDKVLKEESKNKTGEPTSYLLLLGIISVVKAKKSKLKSVRISGITYEKLDMAVSLMFFRAIQISLSRLFKGIKETAVPYYSEKKELILMSTIEPLAFMAIPKTVISASINPYGINEEIYTQIKLMVAGIEEGESVENLLAVAEKVIKEDKYLQDILMEYLKVTMIRGFILKYLVEFDVHGVDAHKYFYSIVNEDRLLKQIVGDKKSLKKLSDAVDAICKDFSKDVERVKALSEFKDFLKGMNKKNIFTKANKQFDLDEVLFGYYSLLFDARVEKFAGHMRMYMIDRRLEVDNETLIKEYKSGRLYRFSVDDRPVLSGFEVKEEGQLFVDMKDFTRKTLSVKEVAMVDFMKENFYDPILGAASRYKTGSGVLEVDNGIRLNSLPGDAAVFSGGVANLVSLARDIQKVSRQYTDKLVARLPPVKGEVVLEDVHKKRDSIIEVLRAKRVDLNERLKGGEEGAKAQLAKLDIEEGKIEESYREALEGVIASELEAGLFISHGAKAESMVLNPSLGETLTVAIGEKINEASRGADRNAMVRAKMEMRLEAERNRRKRPAIKYPFEVFIDDVFSVKLSTEIDDAVSKILNQDKSINTQKVAERIGLECFGDLKKMASGQKAESLKIISASTGIYNMGEAMSKEAFLVYMEETKATKYFFKKNVQVTDFHQSIRNDFYFTSDSVELWFGVEAKFRVELVEGFANVGEVVFKGFESKKPTVVYEILDIEGSFMRSIMAHHFRAWHDEYKIEMSKKEKVN